MRFRIAHLLVLTTIVAVVVALTTNGDLMFVFVAVIVTNFIGMIVGILVTTIGGLPDDGSLPRSCRDDDPDDDKIVV